MPRSASAAPFSLIASAPLGSSTWLLNLRSFAVAGQLVTIIAAQVLADARLPMGGLLGLVAVTATTNIGYGLWLRFFADEQGAAFEDPDEELSDGRVQTVGLALLLLDMIVLTAMLFLSGGAGNPFSFFYFVNLAVGGVMLRRVAAWTLTAVAIGGYAFLLFVAEPVEIFGDFAVGGWDVRTISWLLAMGTCASVVTYFVTRTAGEVRERSRQLARIREAQAASTRLEGLTTLAAGAAHELATPLSTIDVIVRELSRHLDGLEKPDTVDQDLKLIDYQLEMCRQILARMRSAAGDSMEGAWHRTTVGDLIDVTLEGIRDPHRVDVTDGTTEVESAPLWVPREAVAQAIRNLIHNGLDASGDRGGVTVVPKLDEDHVTIAVIDRGDGMTDEVLERASNPFYTTKEPGRGIGLGLFLTRNVVSQLGGELHFRSEPGQGTEAIVTIPLADGDGNAAATVAPPPDTGSITR